MLLIQDILISDDLFEARFHCDLEKCLGACCWEGDYGAPLYPQEVETISRILPLVKTILNDENRQVLEKKGPSEWYIEPEVTGTSLMPDTSCVYLIREGKQIGKCAFEILYKQGLTDFKKPVSCELYPVRLIENEELGFTAMNYDKWDICSPACLLGEKMQMPVFRFVASGVRRKFGASFYEEMEAYYQHLKEKNDKLPV